MTSGVPLQPRRGEKGISTDHDLIYRLILCWSPTYLRLVHHTSATKWLCTNVPSLMNKREISKSTETKSSQNKTSNE